MENGRYQIALLVANIIDPFSNAVSKGAMAAAKRLNADLTIFPGKYLGIRDKFDVFDTTYEYQHNVLFDYAAKGGFDYIIAAVGSIAYSLNSDGQKAFLDSLGSTPVLALAAEIEGYDCLEYDNKSVMYDIVDELVSQGRQNIGIMAGNLNNGECLERYEAFKDALKKHGITPDIKNCMTCDLSESCAEEAAMLIKGSPELDAIVCANDKIAMVVYEQLKKYKRAVGKDVAVVGFDDLPESAELDPPLATVRADAEGLGARSVEMVINKLNGKDDNSKYYPTEFVKRTSCSKYGFPPKSEKRISESECADLKKAAEERIHIDNIFVRDTLLFGNSIGSGFTTLLKRLSLIGANTSFIYTFDEPYTNLPGDTVPQNIKTRFRAYCYGIDTTAVPEEEQEVSFKQVFDNERLCIDRQHCFIVSALFTAEKQYGIALLEPADSKFFEELELVSYILSSALRTIEVITSQELLLGRLKMANLALEKESKVDDLTGVYNRRGFYLAAEKLIEGKDKNTEYILCYADMDNLKMINDIHGHMEGDFSLRLSAECMRSVFGKKAVIGRLGGDEFAAVIPATKRSEHSYMAKKEKFVNEFNSSHQKPYIFGLSMGVIRRTCENSYDIKAALDKADDLLYDQKQKRRKEI
ncbi:MAG: GGDEF domain-containing protein [Ruminococcus sp.]|nr:GGDEF domain-containing protein [Ruminococcus sp.]